MKYKAVIFDLDGTLLDTLQDLANSTNHALEVNGLPQRSLDEVRQFVGNGVRRLMELAVGNNETDFEKVFNDFKQHYAIHCNDYTKPYEGIFELIYELKKRGISCAIVSNKAQFAVDELKELYFKGILDVAIGEKEGIRKKPAPDTVEEACRQLGVKLEDCVYVGDSEVDILTAQNCRIDCISVTWGFRSVESLKQNGATVLCDEPADILKVIEQ
ncbi:MAG: HAD-IA family hydrolase [Erysipelotrichaceae bacterium]|nr:HAD-IA family hydrolase [Erysipelotrichaceae bacterium]